MIPENFLFRFIDNLRVKSHRRLKRKLDRVRYDIQVYRESLSGDVVRSEYTENYLNHVARKIPGLEAKEQKLASKLAAIEAVTL